MSLSLKQPELKQLSNEVRMSAVIGDLQAGQEPHLGSLERKGLMKGKGI